MNLMTIAVSLNPCSIVSIGVVTITYPEMREIKLSCALHH